MDAQEASALLEGLGTETRNLQQFLSGGEGAVFVSVGDDIVRNGRGHASNATEQRCGSGVDLHADSIHGVLHHGIERVLELGLGNVVLILPNADGLRIDFDELGKRVLQAAGNRHSTAERDIHVRELSCGQGRCGVHGGTGLRNHHRGQLLASGLSNQIGYFASQGFGLAGSGAIADSHELHAVRGTESGQLLLGARPVIAWLVRVDDGSVEHLAGGVDNGALHTIAVSRIQAESGALTSRGSQQQVAQVTGEDIHGFSLSALLQSSAGVEGSGHLQLGTPAETNGLVNPLGGTAVGKLKGLTDHVFVGLIFTRIDVESQDALGLSTQHGQHTVAGHGLQRFVVLEVVAVLRARSLLALHHGSGGRTGRPHLLTNRAHQISISSEAIDQNGTGTRQSVLRILTSSLAVFSGQSLGIRGGVGQ